MKILITGAAGFLGLHLALGGKKNQLTLVDIARFQKDEYPKGCRFVTADVRNAYAMRQLIKGQDVVIHAAAALPLEKASVIHATNFSGTRNVIDACLEYKIKRLVYVSSTAVYGVPKKHPIEETDPRVGVGPYGISKIHAEDLCFEAMQKGLPVTIIRPKTFVGTHRLGVFEILFDWIHDGKRIPIIGNGNNRYQLLDVDDLVEAIYLFCKNGSKPFNGAFNIGAETFQTVEKDLNDLFKSAESGSRLLKTPAAPVKAALFLFEKLKLSPLYQWVYDTADKDSFVSIDKLVSTLKWHPRYSNAQALIKSYRWYMDNYNEIKTRPAGTTHTVGWRQGILGFFKRFL